MDGARVNNAMWLLQYGDPYRRWTVGDANPDLQPGKNKYKYCQNSSVFLKQN